TQHRRFSGTTEQWGPGGTRSRRPGINCFGHICTRIKRFRGGFHNRLSLFGRVTVNPTKSLTGGRALRESYVLPRLRQHVEQSTDNLGRLTATPNGGKRLNADPIVDKDFEALNLIS